MASFHLVRKHLQGNAHASDIQANDSDIRKQWDMNHEDNPNGWTVALHRRGCTAFMLVTLRRRHGEPELMAETALEAMRAEYQGLEAEDKADMVAGLAAIPDDMRFFSFDLTNSCWTRSFYCGSGTALVMWQANDLELERLEPILAAIVKSIRKTSFSLSDKKPAHHREPAS
ncbi:MAG: hypothetical protein U0744_17330 [Gemmataceae bacterium]